MKILSILLTVLLLGVSPGLAAPGSKAPAEVTPVPFARGFPVTRRDRIYDLSEVKRGDRGVGYTVFAGAKVEPFQVEVLGIMESMLGPGKDVILARLSGEKIEFSGVIAGMSGSPVFVDGRLMGAVSYRFGAFTREPIAGITPIRSMLELYGAEVGPAVDTGAGFRGSAHRDPGAHANAFDGPLSDDLRLLVERRFGSAERARPAFPAPFGTDSLRPIGTPLAVSGLDPASMKALEEQLSPAGFRVVAGGGAGESAAPFSVRSSADRQVQPNRADAAGTVEAAPIAPAAPVAVVLMRGAVNASALCTVTMVEKNRVYGCGHPFVGFGHVRFPMATAAIVNTLASAMGSYKQSAAAREVGVIDQDRLTAIGGQLGRAAPMVPVRVVVRRRDQARRDAAVTDVEIVDDPVWLPVMVESIVGSAINRRLGFEAGGTLEVRTRINADDQTLEYDETFSAPPPMRLGGLAAGDVSMVSGILLQNELGRASIRGIEVQVVVEPAVSIAEVLRVTPDRTWAEPGASVGLTVELKPYRQPVRHLRLNVRIPETAEDSVTVYVGGGIALDRRDARARGPRVPSTIEDLVKILGDRRPARAVFARLYLPQNGLRKQDTLLPALPPSALATLMSDGAPQTAAVKETLGPEVRRPDPDVVVGGIELKIEIRR